MFDPHISYHGQPGLEPRCVGYKTWELFAQETLVCGPRAAPLCDTQVCLHMNPEWYAILEYRVIGDPHGRVIVHRVAHYTEYDVVFFLESHRHMERSQSAPRMELRREDRLATRATMAPRVRRGDLVATVKMRRCLIPDCDHRSCN